MRGKLALTLVLGLVIAFPALGGTLVTGKLTWSGTTDLVEVSKENARNGKSSLLFDTTVDANPTSRMATANIGGEIEGTLEGWLLDDPAVQPVWITFGNHMTSCIGVQFGNQETYTLRIGGANNVKTEIARIKGWVGFRLEFTGAKVIYHISVDDGKTWVAAGESEAYKTFKDVHIRNNENTGKGLMAAYFDDIKATDSNGNTVLFEGFGGDAETASVSVADKLPAVWAQIKASR